MNIPYIIFFVNLPLFSYLCESYFEGKDANEQYTFAFSLLLLFLYALQFLLVLTFKKNLQIKGNYVYIFLVLIFLCFIGIGLSDTPVVPLLVLLQYLTLFLLLNQFLFYSLKDLQNILFVSLISMILGFCFFAIMHSVVSNGDYLFTLAQIQIPVIVFSYITIRKTVVMTEKQLFLLYLCLTFYLAILFLGSEKALLLQQYRIQFLPVGLTSIIIFLYLPRKIKYLVFPPLMCIPVLYYDSVVGILAYRLGSFSERVSLFYKMASESSYFLIAKGLGSSLKQYDLSTLEYISGSERKLFPPHSGIAVILVEFSIPVILLIAALTISQITKSIQVQRVDLSNDENFLRVQKHSVPALGILFVLWFFENTFYLKAVISGATFSDDFLFLTLLLFVFLVRLKSSCQKSSF